MWGFNCARPISANGVTHLKSCAWRWDYKSRVTTSLKLFISCVIALLPPGYLNSLLYLSLWMSPHLKIITASSVPCPEMTAHTFLRLYCSAQQKKPGPISWELLGAWYGEIFFFFNLLDLINFSIVFHDKCWKVLLGRAVSQHNLPLLLEIQLYSALPGGQHAWWEAGCSSSRARAGEGACEHQGMSCCGARGNGS